MTRKLNIWLSTSLLALSLGSCSLLSNTATVIRGDQGTVPAASAQPASVASAQGSNASVLPKKQNKPQTAKIVATSEMINGEWVIVKAANHQIRQDDEMPYINFDCTDDKFYAYDGCNVLNGNYALDNTGCIIFLDVISSRMSCPGLPYIPVIDSVIKDGVRVTAKFDDSGQETYLYFTTKVGNISLTLRKHNMEMLNGKWTVSSIGKRDVSGNDANIFIDIPELKVHGNTGCNFFNGSIQIDPDVKNSISFSNMAVTMRLCENAEVERLMLVALEQAYSYKTEGNDKLLLFDDQGAKIMTLQRADIR